MHLIRTLVVCLLCAAAGSAETRNLLEHPQPGARPSKLWRFSVAVLAAGTAADAWSSYGHMETNPLLRGPGGRFSGKAIGIKAAVAGSSVAAQWLILRKRPETARSAAITNLGMAGVFFGVAARNRAVLARTGGRP
jgi:hypothetical protein